MPQNAKAAIAATEMKHPLYIDRSIAIACVRGREAVVSRFQDLLAEHDLTEQQWRTLRVLYEKEPIPLTQLCQYCCIHKVSMARILKYLDARGLASRTRSKDDKRAYYVSLTQAGRDLLSQLAPEANRIYDTISRDFGPQKTRLLLQLLHEIAQINNQLGS